ncbi:MAG: peptidoglycan-binding protein [Bryobacteraceae bacterium]|nr:peptidoglycan-binding protein [Bryobacteraceae bacterium]
MPDIKDSVGDGGKNLTHDVALVQVMLRVVKDAKSNAFLAGNYDGSYGTGTKTAIMNFQNEHKLIPDKNPQETIGKMIVSGPSITKLSAMLPAEYKDLLVMPNQKTVYVPGTAADARASETAISADTEFEPSFRTKVASLVRQMFDTHKIVLWLTPTGRRRTFAQQAAEVNTKAGPGESNHNFGRAVDIGFKDFKWVQGDGALKKDAPWLNSLEPVKAAEANAFWDARDALATKLGMFRLQFERVHLQAFDQKTVSNQNSLAKLLNTAGTMQWKTAYQSDLGSAGKHWVKVGTAKEIWAQTSSVSKADIAKARAAATGKVVKETDIKADEVTQMKKSLKADFEAADKNWLKWQGVP